MNVVERRALVGKVYLFFSRQGKEQEASIVQIKFLGGTTNSSGIKEMHVTGLTFAFPLVFTCHLDEPCTIERIHHITCAVFVRVALMTHSCQHASEHSYIVKLTWVSASIMLWLLNLQAAE